MPTVNVHNCEVKKAISSFLKKMQFTDYRAVGEVDLTTLWRKQDMVEVILFFVEPLVEEEAMVAEVVIEVDTVHLEVMVAAWQLW